MEQLLATVVVRVVTTQADLTWHYLPNSCQCDAGFKRGFQRADPRADRPRACLWIVMAAMSIDFLAKVPASTAPPTVAAIRLLTAVPAWPAVAAALSCSSPAFCVAWPFSSPAFCVARPFSSPARPAAARPPRPGSARWPALDVAPAPASVRLRLRVRLRRRSVPVRAQHLAWPRSTQAR